LAGQSFQLTPVRDQGQEQPLLSELRLISFQVVGFYSAEPHQLTCRKPILLTGGWQLPRAIPRCDARQNLIGSVTCLTAFSRPPHVNLPEVAVCFRGRLVQTDRWQRTIFVKCLTCDIACAGGLPKTDSVDRLAAAACDASFRRTAEPHRLSHVFDGILQPTSRQPTRGRCLFWGPPDERQPVSKDTQ
jgi:hypothetical protein